MLILRALIELSIKLDRSYLYTPYFRLQLWWTDLMIQYEPEHLCTLDAYYESISPEKVEFARFAFYYSIGVIDFLSERYRYKENRPTISVRISDTFQASAKPYTIVLHSSLVEEILFSPSGHIHAVLGDQFFKFRGLGLESIAGLIWVIGHEWTHIVRCHDKVEEEAGSDIRVKHALELDADLCAAAALFRYMHQRLDGHATADEILAITVNSLFWGIRRVAPSAEAGEHPPTYIRWYLLLVKLASLNPVDGQNPDNYRTTPGYKHRWKIVTAAFKKCETMQRIYDHTRDDVSLMLDKILELTDADKLPDLVDYWHEISPIVERISKTEAITRPLV